MFSSIISNLLWTEGRLYLILLSGITLISYFISPIFLFPAIVVFFFLFYFFRNPERFCLQALSDANVLICPADGKVVDIARGYGRNPLTKVSIFLSPLDVHVNWIPCTGTIENVVYRTGAFYPAFVPKSSDLNEANDVHIALNNGTVLVVRQIAGTVARRICCWVKKGDRVAAGKKYGMIKFSSRIDVFLPANVVVAVALGQRVVGGETVLGRFVWH